MDTFTDLEAWKVGMELMKEVYMLTRSFPKAEQYGLTSQIRKSASSVLANLAEGFSRSTPADKAHKYTISRGECSETKAFLLIAIALGLLPQENAQKALSLSEHTGRLISGLINRYQSQPQP